MEGRSVVLMVVRMEGRLVDQMEGRSVVLMVVRTEGRSVVLMVVRTEGRSVDLKVAPKEGLMEGHLVDLRDLLEVRVALHRFAQLVLVLVQALLQVLRELGLVVVSV